jgi:uncharacterized protein (DUF983 family)
MSLSSHNLGQIDSKSLPPVSQESTLPKASRPPRRGDRCPVCESGYLDYDGLLNLACQECGFSFTGCFT